MNKAFENRLRDRLLDQIRLLVPLTRLEFPYATAMLDLIESVKPDSRAYNDYVRLGFRTVDYEVWRHDDLGQSVEERRIASVLKTAFQLYSEPFFSSTGFDLRIGPAGINALLSGDKAFLKETMTYLASL